MEPRGGIFKQPRNRFRGIDSASPCSLSPYCNSFNEPRNRFPALRSGKTTLFVVAVRQAIQAGKSIPGLRKRLQITIRALAGRYGNHIPTRFLAPIDCSKESIPRNQFRHMIMLLPNQPPPHLPSASCLSFSVFLTGEGVEETKNTTAKKPGPRQII
jgi:hypothetical protein